MKLLIIILALLVACSGCYKNELDQCNEDLLSISMFGNQNALRLMENWEFLKEGDIIDFMKELHTLNIPEVKVLFEKYNIRSSTGLFEEQECKCGTHPKLPEKIDCNYTCYHKELISGDITYNSDCLIRKELCETINAIIEYLEKKDEKT